MLTLESLVIRQDTFVLRADLSLQAGTVAAVIGPSGAGKSTLLNVIAGFFAPVQGRVLWQGQDITTLPPAKRPISMLFQDNNLFPHLTAAQNVGLGIRPDLRRSQGDEQRVSDALRRVGLDGYGARKPGALSGGQQGRVALARVLVQRRPLILLDEPFAALGPALKAEMLDLVADLARETGATLLMVSHDPFDARRIAPLTILVAEGTALPPQPTDALLDNPPPSLAAYLGD
ncbi:ATP-binding cassette domain-containing protein [Seohaeicola saemankumensis]|uniref:thiamine ABC transporter ATP-binding protein n=1 Tax=Seohaeicola TaxID=481178 RepID=UPI0007F388D2|nr:thiamine ABC transporter ATP-binding protein [Rhodobacteraceae bacterium EhC02]